MTPDQQRLAVAQACGWTNCKYDYDIAGRVHSCPLYGWVGVPPLNSSLGYDGSKDWHYWVLPNYIDDLDDMHAAEIAEGIPGRTDYYWTLFEIIHGHPMDYDMDPKIWLMVHATAAQRAEAFLKTLNLWQPES